MRLGHGALGCHRSGATHAVVVAGLPVACTNSFCFPNFSEMTPFCLMFESLRYFGD